MNKAGELLASTRLSVAEIAAQVGYLNQSKFASVFKSILVYHLWNIAAPDI